MVNVCACMNGHIMCCGENKESQKGLMYGESRARNGLRHPSVREKEEKRWTETPTEKEREGERKRQGGIDKLKTACGCTDTGCETDKKKETEGGSDRAQRQEEGVKDSQPERVTECSPERESVWVNVRAALANASVNLNL